MATLVMTGSPSLPPGVASIRAYEVVMATCNGRAYLHEQLETLLHQSIPPTRLVVVDDASLDGSANLIEAWASSNAMPLVMIQHEDRQGSTASFADALTASGADYVFLSDQDDIWDLGKAECLLTRMAELEACHGHGVPLLVHSDLRLVDAKGIVQVTSFHRHQRLDPHRDQWLDLAMQNVVTGCATLINRACLEAALPFPEEAVLHDWWLALVASGLGVISYVERPTLSYRQHGRNLVGAAGFQRQMARRVWSFLRWRNTGSLVAPGLAQLLALWDRFAGRLQPPLSARQGEYLRMLNSPSVGQRLKAALRLRLSKQGWFRTAGFFLCLLIWQPSKR